MNVSTMFDMERACEPRDDLISELGRVHEIVVKVVGPDMADVFDIKQSYVNADLVAGAVDRTFKDILYPKLLTDRLGASILSLEGKRRITRNYKCAAYRARQLRRDVLGDAIYETILGRIVG